MYKKLELDCPSMGKERDEAPKKSASARKKRNGRR
jgi:hypothetical protein